jgi:hypothetical protein
MKIWSRFVIALVIAAGVGILRVPILQAVTASYNSTVRIVDSAGNVINGVASAVTASYNSTVRVVDSTGHVIDSFGGASPANPQVATVTLTSAQVKALDTTPVPLIAAQGTNKVILPYLVLFQSKFGGTAYSSDEGSSLNVGYGSSTNDILSFTDTGQQALLTAGSSQNLNCVVGSSTPCGSTGLLTGTAYAPATASNQAVNLVNQSGHSYNNGPIVTATLAAGGNGYVVGDTGVIDPALNCSDGNATYTVLSAPSGHVATFSVTSAGGGYQTGAACNPYDTGTGGGQPGVGTGFTVNVTAVTAGNSTLAVTVYYQVVTLQ